MRYGVVWHPSSRNLGEDIQALAAGALLPRIDAAVDGGRLDEAPPGDGSPLAVLLGGHLLRRRYSWPPHPTLRPVLLGAHISREDVWGGSLADLAGLGLDYLRTHGPVGCRDEATAALLQEAGIDSEVTCCLTLTLERPGDVPRRGPYVCCVDVPDKAVEALQRYAKAASREVRVMTHQLPPEALTETFQQRMERAQAAVRAYAGAAFVVTRRLHCALACLAVETPVLLLYNSGYEDPRRFAPMDALFPVAAVEDFIASVGRGGFPTLAENPGKYLRWRRLLKEKAAAGLARAATQAPAPAPDAQARAAWQGQLLRRLAVHAAGKIQGLEREQYDLIHDKFSLLLTEDSVKSRLLDCLAQPGLEQALARYALGRALARLPWWKRPAAHRRWKAQLRRGESPPEVAQADPLTLITAQLARLGWPTPEGKER